MIKKQVEKKKVAAYPLMNADDVLDIADYLEESTGKFGFRNKVLFLLGCSTGYRAGDLVELKVRDVKMALEDGYFRIYENKVNKKGEILEKKKTPREAIIIDELSELLKEYIKDKKSYEYMFLSNKKNSEKPYITVECISKIIKKAATHFGLKRITAHSMRKTYGWNQYIISGKNTGYVQELFGHESEEYTKKYLNINDIEAKKYSRSLSKFFR